MNYKEMKRLIEWLGDNCTRINALDQDSISQRLVNISISSQPDGKEVDLIKKLNVNGLDGE